MGLGGILNDSSETVQNVETCRAEVVWLLTSGVLGRSGNITRVLRYICEETFQGRAEELSEYTIASSALGRRADFHPQTDTIVRVTFHTLRRRLNEVYETEAAEHPVRLVIPAGQYAPLFLERNRPAPPETLAETGGAEAQQSASAAEPQSRYEMAAQAEPQQAPPAQPVSAPAGRRRAWQMLWAAALIPCALAVVWWIHREAGSNAQKNPVSALPVPVRKELVRALMGPARAPYRDHSGDVWTAEAYCQGGTNVLLPPQDIEGTQDSPLYLGGVRGIAHCVFPVGPGMHEIHLYFAETTDLPPATRLANISINAGPQIGVDVVDSAGGRSIATSKVITGVTPENDGAIRLDFTSETSLLNAVEILPANSAALLPVRIAASTSPIVDANGQVWSADRYFSGGRHGQPHQVIDDAAHNLFAVDRVGRFRYNIPVQPLKHYRVHLYFREPWFGEANGVQGGPGSRVFDVSSNGTMLLKGFDILANDRSGKVVKVLDHVQADATGRLELSFAPVVNYPVVSAIEVLPED